MDNNQPITLHITYGGSSGNSRFAAFSKVTLPGQVSAYKTATSHMLIVGSNLTRAYTDEEKLIDNWTYEYYFKPVFTRNEAIRTA